MDTETGELQERRLDYPEAAEKFYRELAAQEMKIRVGMEASSLMFAEAFRIQARVIYGERTRQKFLLRFL